MAWETWLTFVGAAIVIAVSPGPTAELAEHPSPAEDGQPDLSGLFATAAVVLSLLRRAATA